MKSFSSNVYALCSKIPHGRVSTYKEIARALGTKAYRAVGSALNKNPFAPRVPCHRVVRSDRRVGGFAKGARKKKELLEKEGVKIKDDRIVDFDRVFFSFEDKSTL